MDLADQPGGTDMTDEQWSEDRGVIQWSEDRGVIQWSEDRGVIQWSEDREVIGDARRIALRTWLQTSADRLRQDYYVMVPLPPDAVPESREREFIRRCSRAVGDVLREMDLL